MRKELLEARTCFQTGDFARAEQLCRRVLEESPVCADALHFLGVASLHAGRHTEAVDCLKRAIAADGANALIHNTLGVAWTALRKYDQAVESFRNAVELAPQLPDAHYNLAKALRAAGRLEEALPCYRTATVLRPRAPEIHCGLGSTLHKLQRFEDAADSYREALRVDSTYLKARKGLGSLYRQQRRFADAEACYREAVQIHADYAAGHVNLGGLAMRRKAYVEAERRFSSALRIDPHLTAARAGLATALIEQGRLDEAAGILESGDNTSDALIEAQLRLGEKLRLEQRHDEAIAWAGKILEIKPGLHTALQSLGLALAGKGELDDAVAAYRKALDARPDFAEVHNNLAVALQALGDYDAAMHHLDTALRIDPSLPMAHLNRAVLWLQLGDFKRGWAEFEWRRVRWGHRSRKFQKPLWMGQPLADHTVLVYSEQGLGDTIQFIRYAPLAKRRVSRLIVECQEPLVRLLSRCPGVDHLLPRGAKLPDHDASIFLASLPAIFDTCLGTMPADLPYIFPDEQLVQTWRNWLAEFGEFKIGIAWQGSPEYAGDAHRSVPLRHFARIAGVGGVRLVSLQKGFGTEQMEELAGEFPVTDLGPDLDTAAGAFMDTAALMHGLDLIVTSDTAIAHLAGAMGRPVWTVLSTCPDWRWLTDRQDSPWYPSMRLFRQKRLGDWDELFARVADELRRVVEGDPVPLQPYN